MSDWGWPNPKTEASHQLCGQRCVICAPDSMLRHIVVDERVPKGILVKAPADHWDRLAEMLRAY